MDWHRDALLALATGASAQTNVSDLKGSWSGTAEIVHRSEVAEHVDPTDKPSFLTLPFTITIEQQETPARCWRASRA
jgi:hypothetical protein